MRIFLAGAAGVIGRRLMPLLVLMGHDVTGTTRSTAKAGQIEAMCGRPVVADVYDAVAHAALLALTRGAPGIYNIAEDDGAASIAKVRAQLGFDPAIRLAA